MIPGDNIMDFGAKPDGLADCSPVFARLFDQIREKGEGVVLVPAGVFLTGPLELPDNTTLRIAKGATLLFLDDPERYVPVETRWEGVVCHAMHPLIFARNAKNVAIIGEGVIDGNGHAWWEAYRRKKAEKQAGPVSAIEKRLGTLNNLGLSQPSGGGGRETQFLRPPLVQFLNCDGVTIRGVTLRNSPFWTLHPVFSSRILIDNVKIENPSDAPNTDGIDIDSCSDITIVDSVVDVGDDCLALKAGAGPQGLAENRPTRNVRISGCTFLSGHGGVVIGSETAGGIENVDVTNCRFVGSDRGIRIKSRRGRGGKVQNLLFQNLVMDKVLAPLTINLYYNCGAKAEDATALFSKSPEPVSPLTPKFRNIKVLNLVATGCRASAGFIVGLPESKIDNLVLENCIISLACDNLVPVSQSEMYQGVEETANRGLRLRNVSCSLNGVRIENCGDIGIHIEEGCAVTPARLP
ncbi:MAG TPA: glycoside hydrolase family 28 protein [Rectinemataceae bacterium]|nr:glycoside hydrolase family 28 protein [Rectinemataceae bacterium]